MGRLVSSLFLLAGAAGLAAQAVSVQLPPRDSPAKPQVGTGSIAGGIVANDASAAPIRRVILLLGGGDIVIARQTTTDDAGRFVISALPAGRYTLQGWRNGFVRDYYGNKRPGIGSGSPIIVADGQVHITMKMTRSAVITGTILPSSVHASYTSVRISPMQYQTIGGERRLSLALTGGVTASFGTGVDDRGVFRLYGLAPGEYVIAATAFAVTNEIRPMLPAEVQWATQQFAITPPSGPTTSPMPERAPALGYAPVFYPGTTDPAAAATITVGPGEERGGVDFALQLAVVARIEGVILGPDGQAPQALRVILAPSAASPAPGATTTVRTSPDGKFSATGILPGHYTLMARGAARGAPGPAGPPIGMAGGGGAAPSSGTPSLWAAVDVEIDGRDLTNLVATLQPGVTVSGRAAFDGPPITADEMRRVRVVLSPVQSSAANSAMLGQPTTMVDADGTFTIPGVVPGKYRLTGFAPISPGAAVPWIVTSAVVNGQDSLDDPVEIPAGQNTAGTLVTFTNRPTELSGRLIDPVGQPAPDFFIVAFSTQQRFWTTGSRRIAQTRPDSTGAFKITTLPPGEYYLCAMADLDSGQLTDGKFLEAAVGASVKVTLTEGQKTTQDLKLAGGGTLERFPQGRSAGLQSRVTGAATRD